MLMKVCHLKHDSPEKIDLWSMLCPFPLHAQDILLALSNPFLPPPSLHVPGGGHSHPLSGLQLTPFAPFPGMPNKPPSCLRKKPTNFSLLSCLLVPLTVFGWQPLAGIENP